MIAPLRRRGSKLSLTDVGVALRLAEEGKSQATIAELLGVNQSNVSRALAAFTDTRTIAKSRLNQAADRVAKDALVASAKAAKRGDAAPALEILDRLDVAPRKHQDGSGGAKVMVVIGQPSVGALPPGLSLEPS